MQASLWPFIIWCHLLGFNRQIRRICWLHRVPLAPSQKGNNLMFVFRAKWTCVHLKARQTKSTVLGREATNHSVRWWLYERRLNRRSVPLAAAVQSPTGPLNHVGLLHSNHIHSMQILRAETAEDNPYFQVSVKLASLWFGYTRFANSKWREWAVAKDCYTLIRVMAYALILEFALVCHCQKTNSWFQRSSRSDSFIITSFNESIADLNQRRLWSYSLSRWLPKFSLEANGAETIGLVSIVTWQAPCGLISK